MPTEEAVTLALLQATHLAGWAFAYGALTYTYYRLNAQMLQFAGDGFEAFADATSDSLHRWVLGSLAVAGLSGAALAAATPGARTGTWWLLVALKTAILGALLLVQALVARRMWPRRRRAAQDQWPVERRRFFRAALLTSFLLLCQLVLGSLAHAVAHASR